MFSILNPKIVYQDISSDITEHDLDIMSDLWEMDGHSVYRGARDPRYTHANVFWLYNEDLQRVGCAEHSLDDHAVFHLLWFYDSPFATMLQEPGWKIGDEIWYALPRHVFERCINEGWTTPDSLLEQCLHSNIRIVTPSMLVNLPIVHECKKCGIRSLTARSCTSPIGTLDFPPNAKIFFIDDDMVVHTPPEDSSILSTLRQHGGDSLQVQAGEQSASPSQASSPPPPDAPPPSPHSESAAAGEPAS